MTTDLDNDLYKEDADFQYDQLVQFSQRDKLPFPKQEDFIDYEIRDILHAPTIKIVQEGLFTSWRRYIRLNRLAFYKHCNENDYSRKIKLILKNKALEPERPKREGLLQQCYKGYCLIEDFMKINFKHIETREFVDFLNVMGVIRPKVQLINYLQIIRNTYIKLPILIEMRQFQSIYTHQKFNEENAANLIQLAFRRYKNHMTEVQKQIRIMSSLNAEELFIIIKDKISNSDKSLKEVFEIFDYNKDGHIEFNEFIQAFRDSNIPIAEEVLQTVFKYFDINNNNSIQYMEFLSKIQVRTVSNDSLLSVQFKVEQTVEQLRQVMRREFKDLQEMINSLQASDRLKIKKIEFLDFVMTYTLRFSKIQLDNMFHYLDHNNKNYLTIEDFSQIFTRQSLHEVREEKKENKQQEQRAIQNMQSEIDNAKFLYHYIQAEDMQGFIQERDNQLLDLLKTNTQQGNAGKRVSFSMADIETRANIYKNSLLKLEILIQQISNKVLLKLQQSGLTVKQFFSQFTQKFPEKFIEPKEFLLMLNVLFNQVMDVSLSNALFRIISNQYTARVSLAKFEELIMIGQQISPIQLRMKFNYGSYVAKLKPKLLEEFQKIATISIDMKTVTLKQTLSILNQFGLKLEMFEIQKLADSSIISLKDRMYTVDYGRLLSLMFPDVYLGEQLVLKKFGMVILKLWRRMKQSYFLKKASGKFNKKQNKRQPKPLGTKRSLKEKMSETLPAVQKQNEYTKIKSGDLYSYAKTIILECVEGAVYFAETQIFTQQKQQTFQKRPTIKDLFIFHPFQSFELPNLLGTLSYDYLTQRLYMPDKQSILYTQDICGNRMLQNINIGTKLPFNKSFIVDCLIFNQKMFILKSNWQLQMWSMSQKSDRHELAIDLREGAPNAQQNAQHLCQCEDLLLVISSLRTHIHIISSISLHIIKIVNFVCILDFHFKYMNEIMNKVATKLIQETNNKFPIKLEMTLTEMEQQEQKRRESLNFMVQFKDSRVQKGKLLHFFTNNQSSDKEIVKQYFDQICDEEGYISQQQYEEILKDKQKNKYNIYDALNIIKISKVNLRQLFSTYDDGKNIVTQKQLFEMLESFNMKPQVRHNFVCAFPNGISFQEFSKLIESPITYDELLYRCESNRIDLVKLFQQCDVYNVGLLDRNDFYFVLSSLPFGLLDTEIDQLSSQQVYDSESGRIKYREKPQAMKQRVKQVQFINDLNVVIVSVYYPKRGTIFCLNDKNILALLEYHKEAPMLYYVNESGCLLSAEGLELCIWTIYRDLTLKYDVNPPWTIKPQINIKLNAQISQIGYLPFNQLIMVATTEGINFYDPVSYQQQSSKVQVRVKPGYYKELEEFTSNQQVPLVNQLELQKIVSLNTGLLQTPFESEDATLGSTLLSLEFMIIMTEIPMGQNSKNLLNPVKIVLVHRQSLEIPSTQLDVSVPQNILNQIQSDLERILQQALMGKRARGVIGIEKELNKEQLKIHTKRQLIKLSKQLTLNKQPCQQDILNEISHSCGGILSYSYVYNLLRSCQCLNPHNISFEEFKYIVQYSEEYKPVIKIQNQIESKLQSLVREGKIDLPLEFELQKAMRLSNDKILMKHQFKKLLMKFKAYSNEKDLNDFVQNDFVSLKSLMEKFENDKLIYKLRMISRPDQIIKEIQKLGIPRQFLARLAMADENGDGILTKKQFMSAVSENQALFSEFFDLYSENLNDEPIIRIKQITSKLLSISEGLQIKKMLNTLAKVKNTLIYRQLGLTHLFRVNEMPYHDFCDCVMDLKIPDVTEKDVKFLADCLAVESNKIIPFQSFQHYLHKLSASDQFLLVADYEDLLHTAEEILQNKEVLRLKIPNQQLCQPWDLRGLLTFLNFDSVDRFLIKVLEMNEFTYDQLIDKCVNFVNKINLQKKDGKSHQQGLLQLVTEDSKNKYISVIKLGQFIKSQSYVQIQKIFQQCIQLDNDKNGFIELPIFCNVIAYNIQVEQSLLINFQLEWKALTQEDNLNYNRFFKEYVEFEQIASNQDKQNNLNQLFIRFAYAVNKSGINLGFVLKRFYNYDNQDFLTQPQFLQLLEQIQLQLTQTEINDLTQFLGEDITHANLLKYYTIASKNTAIVYDPVIWEIAGSQISISTINKLGKWQQSKDLMKSIDFKRLFNQYEPSEQQQIIRFACVGCRTTLEEAQQLTKEIRLNQAELSQYFVNPILFTESLPQIVKSKVKEQVSKNRFNGTEKVPQEPLDDQISVLSKKIQQALKNLNSTVLKILLNQNIIVNANGQLSRCEFKKLLDSLPYVWTMKEKHNLYQKFREPINVMDFIGLFDNHDDISFYIDIIIQKLFMGLYRQQLTLYNFFTQIGRVEVKQSELLDQLQQFMSSWEAKALFKQLFQNETQTLTISQFLEAFRLYGFNDLQLLLRSGLQVLNDSTIDVMYEIEQSGTNQELTIQQIQQLFNRMNIHISLQSLFCLLNNYLMDKTKKHPMFEQKMIKYNIKEFLQFLSQQKIAKSQVKQFYEKLQESHLQIFEFFAVCDSHQDYAITEDEFKYGFIQLQLQKMDHIWLDFEKVDMRVPFQNFLKAFLQTGCIQWQEQEHQDAFILAIKKLGNLNESFIKLADGDQITYKSLKRCHQKYKLDISLEELQLYYSKLKQKYKTLTYKEFAQAMQGERQIEIIHQAFSSLVNVKAREFPDTMTLDQLKQFLTKKQIPSQHISVIVNSFEKQTITNKELEQKQIDYSNLSNLKEQLTSEKLLQFCHAIIKQLKGQPNQFSKIYTQHGLGSINQITYQNLYTFLNYLDVNTTSDILKLFFNTVDTEQRNIVKSTEIESLLRRSQTQARVKTLDHTKKAEVNELLRKGIKNIVATIQSKKIRYDKQLDKIELAEFINQFCILNEPQIDLLMEAISDSSQVQKPTWGDFACYMLEDNQSKANVFFKECLELFQDMLHRLNIRVSCAVKYFGQKRIFIREFIHMMLSLGFNPLKLKLNYKKIKLIFEQHGGDEMSDLEFLMLMSEQEGPGTQLSQPVLEVLMNLYRFAIKNQLSKQQLYNLMNLNKSGWIQSEELEQAIHMIDPQIQLTQIRALSSYLTQEDQLIKVGNLIKLIYIGGSLNDNSIEVNAFFTRVFEPSLLHDIVQLEQIGTGFDGLVPQITISLQDFFHLVPKHKEQDIALMIKSFGLKQDQLDLEKIYECLININEDLQVGSRLQGKEGKQEQIIEEMPLEQSVVLKFQEQRVQQNTLKGQYEMEIIEHICAILNQNQMSLMKSVFQEKGYLSAQEFQLLLNNIGVCLSIDQVRALIKLFDFKSDGNILHYTELLSVIEQQGYQIIKDEAQQVNVYNKLLQKFFALEFGDLNYNDQMTVNEFYRLISLEGERHPFNDNEFQRLANLFTQQGMIQKNLILRILGTQKQNFVDHDLIDKQLLKNIFYRFNGFELVLNGIKKIRELFNQNIETIKQQDDSGLMQISLQINVNNIYLKIQQIMHYILNDIQLIQAGVFNLLNQQFQAQYIQPHLTIRSERTKMSQMQLSLTSVFLTPIPETQFLPIHIPQIEGKQMYYMLGRIAANNAPVIVSVWTVPILQTVCYDGVMLRQHIMEVLRFQSILNQTSKLYGVCEKKNNMGTEVHAFVQFEGTNLNTICQQTGGLLKIPQLVLSGQMIYVAKLWLGQILSLMCDIQNYGYAFPLMRTEILYIFNDEVHLSELTGIQSVNINKFQSGIDIKLLVESVLQQEYKDLALAPEFYSKSIQEITNMADTWSFGVIIFELLFGHKPQIISNSGCYQGDKYLQLTEPSDYEQGDLLQKEVFQNLRKELADIIDMKNQSITQQILLQLDQKSLGAYIKHLFKNVHTDESMLNQISELIDLMCSCLQYEPHNRPQLQSIQKCNILNVDLQNARQIARPIINYKNPRIIFENQIYQPSRQIALAIVKNKPVEIESIVQIIKLFNQTILFSIMDEQKLDLISYLFHSRVLDILNFIVLHLNYKYDLPQLVQQFSQIFIELQQHLQSQESPASQHVEAIITTLVKFTLGEPYRLISDKMFMAPETGFFSTRDDELDHQFKDKNHFYSYWTPSIYKIVAPIYKDMISESGVGSGNMVAIRNYIQLCTEKQVSAFDMNKFAVNVAPVKYNTIARSSEYYSEVMSVSDSHLQIANYLNGSFSKSSVKIALNYVSSLIKSNKISKLQVLVDSRISNLLIQLVTDQEFRTVVLQMFAHITIAFRNEVPTSLRIEHSNQGLVQQYQQNNAVHLLRNLSIISHILTNKNKLSNERFLSFQPTEQNQSESNKIQQLNLYVAESIFALPTIYQGLFVDIKTDPDLVYKIISNLLQWPKVGKYALGGSTQQLLVEMFRPMALQAEHKKSNNLQLSLKLYDEIITMALPNTIDLIHSSKVRIMLQTHNLLVPEKSSSDKFVKMSKSLSNQWQEQKSVITQEIRDQVSILMNGRSLTKKQIPPIFGQIKQALKQIQAYVVYTSKDKLLSNQEERRFISNAFQMIMSIFNDLLTFGQLHQECCDLLQSLADFIMYITLISPLLIFDIEDMQSTKNSIIWLRDTVDFIYEFHIEWDRVNEERRMRIEEINRLKQEEQEKNQKFVESLQQKQHIQESKINKNVTFKLPTDKSVILTQQQQQSQSQSQFQSQLQSIKHSQQVSIAIQNQSLQQSQITVNNQLSQTQMVKSQTNQSQIKNVSKRLQEPPNSQSQLQLEYAVKLELRPYSSNKLIQCALNLLKCLTAIIDSNINQYLQLLTFLNIGTWYTNLTFKQWIIFERVVGPSLEETLIIKNQVDESMVRTSLFEAIGKCQSHGLQEQLINAGFIKGIFSYLLNNTKSFEVQKIVKTHSYVPFIHWMPYRHEALIYFTAIIWERKNCVNFYNEMMIEVHARNTLQEESNHLTTKVDNKTKEANSTIMFTRVYMLCILISANDSGLLFLMKQLKISQKLLQLFQTNEDFRQLFQGIYQYLVSEELEL
ncbi:unnamed protein product [Paramecium pentaurelia]|uniref:EF-hand domain-containing protein n=1 Tax=Paramecium pentaurelia TaxID=43138 RepID=A0A8S1W6E5_9CILI|nr:unnamed protein product [Paramecium pentaurelia]